MGYPVSWAPCYETWLKFESKFASVEKKNEIRDFYLLGSNPLVGRHVVNESKITKDVGRHVVNEPKVGCHVVLNLECCKSDF